MQVLLKRQGHFQTADCLFATVADIRAIKKWRREFRRHFEVDAGDALEFADLACKRWRTYASLRRLVSSIKDLKAVINTDAHAEAAILAVIRCRIQNRLQRVGFCLLRRTWCNHLILDLLASNPNISADVSGVGSSILYFSTSVAESIRAPIIWGEATRDSAPFYTRAFGVSNIQDLFRIERRDWLNFREHYQLKWRQCGLPKPLVEAL